MYFSGQGKVFIGTRDALGVAQALRFVGNVPKLQISPKVQTIDHQESMSGQRATDLRLIKSKSVDFNCMLEDFAKDNLSLALYGAATSVAPGTVTNEALPAGLVAGDFASLVHQSVSALTVTDSAGAPATLALNTNYTINAQHGTIQIVNPGVFVQPFKVNYAFAAVTNINMLTQPLPERFLRFEGLNSADGNKAVLIELYRVSVDPLKSLDLIGDTITGIDLAGVALLDSFKANDALLGQFGRIVQI